MKGGTTATDLAVRCFCGTVRGILIGASPKIGNRAVCYCDDCQAFANFLSTDCGILDEHGGTDIFQTSPAYLEFTRGLEHIDCLRLTPKGTFRWYTDCCRTPIGNTWPTGKVPFVGLIHSCLEPEDRSLDEVLGPVRYHVMAKYANGDMTGIDAYEKFPLHQIFPFMWNLLRWRIRGDHKRSPFFDAETGEPVVTPQVISDIK